VTAAACRLGRCGAGVEKCRNLGSGRARYRARKCPVVVPVGHDLRSSLWPAVTCSVNAAARLIVGLDVFCHRRIL
jgi:hypothetical protein